ncbi:MAG: GntR family transcriptional regulator, transcriptional repressor for pyruvate dehydrogenase complex [Actinomycetota bacterium]|nr:GntR family transcriptional regulator [Cryptosporangiaceae bacterium]MDQ1678492.1 GntR family transcriptional regulator, transcriptional repressor for pyruvate dehydrogenase complex [Actinomycetota bacterium]
MAVTDEAILRIKEMIVSGELRAGQRLPREADLAERLGLSRSSLREAVKALSVIRILDVRQGDGTYVTRLEPNQLLAALSFVVDFHQDGTVLEVLEVRRILEPAATAMAAQHADEATLARLYELCDRSDAADPVDLGRLDAEFHRLVAEASGNSYLAQLLDILSGSAVRARSVHGAGVPRQALVEHRGIVDALAAHRPEVARAWSTVHVTGAEQRLRRPPEGPDTMGARDWR